MSQIEQHFRQLLSKKPEIEKCYQERLINRRALARYLIQKNVAKKNQMDAVIAMIRRYQFKEAKEAKDVLKGMRLNMKDQILIIDFEKDKELLQKLRTLISHTDYDRGDTLKIVIGTTSITIFTDQKKEADIKKLLDAFKIQEKYKNVCEISLTVTHNAAKAQGVVALVSRELALNDITITKLLTARYELLLYVKDSDSVKAFDVLKQLQ